MPHGAVVGTESETRPATKDGLTRADFFAGIVDRLKSELPENLAAFQHKRTQNLLKIYYQNERVHYEVWTNSQRQSTEIGLHFEDGPVSTAAFLAYFDRHIIELKHVLGPEVELERWTQSWGHLFEVTPLNRLTDRLTERTASRLAKMITVLQPLVEAAAVPPERSGHAPESTDSGRRWHRRRR